MKNSDATERDRQLSATVAALLGIAPKDELEGMMAAQLIAAHNAAMECYRRAMLGEQTFEGRRENLSQSNMLSRAWQRCPTLATDIAARDNSKSRSKHIYSMPVGRRLWIEGAPGGGDDGKRRKTSCKADSHDRSPRF
jgi:hypothetical protein